MVNVRRVTEILQNIIDNNQTTGCVSLHYEERFLRIMLKKKHEIMPKDHSVVNVNEN